MSLIRAFVAVLLASSAAFAAPARFTAPSDEAGRAARKPVVGLIVEFRQTAPLQTRLGQLRGDLARLDREPRVERTFSRAIFGATIQVRREHIASIQKLPYVAAVHLEREFKPLEIAQQRDAIATHARAIATSGGAGIKVGVIDTGIDYMHPALGGGFGEGFKVAGGWDFTNNDADPMDDYGHGTHVAGIIAANGSGLTGVAPDVSLIAYKVFNGSGGARESDILAAVERAMDPNGDGDTSDHLDVVNMSLGGPPEVNDPLVSAVERAIAAGVVFCLSNGNGGD
ncbi:MAG TPA: S8 family serine peptidase, partial [Thermoanaerobaculia bacterium]|nr:S8 family serine peptidase [Thermoanaerobaculia bacterium]